MRNKAQIILTVLTDYEKCGEDNCDCTDCLRGMESGSLR